MLTRQTQTELVGHIFSSMIDTSSRHTRHSCILSRFGNHTQAYSRWYTYFKLKSTRCYQVEIDIRNIYAEVKVVLICGIKNRETQ